LTTDAFDYYLHDASRRAPAPGRSYSGAAGGAPCGDLVRVSIALDGGCIAAAGFDAEGCSTANAAGAAVAELVEGMAVLDAARVAPEDVAEALGGLSAQGRHAAELAADALHRALTKVIASGAPLVPRVDRPGTNPAAPGREAEEDANPAAPGREAEEAAGRVLVAISGGVDSAVAAWLERERGAAVVAVTVKLWADRRTDGTRSCCSPQAVLGARALAHSIDIPHLTMDLEEAFRATVVDDFVAGYAAGRTPNPCVRCNGLVRLDAMADLAGRLGARRLATGHYARIATDGDVPRLVAPRDAAKDQTYMLSAVAPRTLARLRFPLAELTKAEVRRIAADAELPVASKPESQDLCFLAGEGKRSFLARHARLPERNGEVVDRAGRTLGRHRGHHNFTVGQRRGLGIAADAPLYVLETDAEANRVVVGSREELEVDRVLVRDAVLNGDGGSVDRVRLRYRSRPLACALEAGGAAPRRGRHRELVVRLAEPAAAVAPGQTASLMEGDAVVGYGTIA
jgi:tRNA-specific 2-thiouridylase